MRAQKRQRPPGAYVGTESRFQASAIKMIRMRLFGSVPEELIMHIPNGRNAGPRMGGFWKSQGVVSGYPDIMIFKPDNHGSPTAIELKVFPNKPSPEQLTLHDLLVGCGWSVHVCYGLGEVEAAISGYLP